MDAASSASACCGPVTPFDPEAARLVAAGEEPTLSLAHYRLGEDQDHQGRPAEAIACYRRALALDPELAPARRALAVALTRLDSVADTVPLWHAELATAEGIAWVDERIASALRESDLTLAGRLAEVTARLRWGSAWCRASAVLAPPAQVPNSHVSVAKLRHDAEQLRYLVEQGVLAAEFSDIALEYLAEADILVAKGVTGQAPLAGETLERLGHVYNRHLYVRPTQRVARALSPSWNPAAVERSYLERPPGVVVVDDFLHPEALAELRAFCLESTVWSANRYSHGRLGAFLRDGFVCPLLLEIAEELRAALPQVIGERYPLRQLWGFKNDETLPADATTHADFAAVNVNFWLTPEDANLESGCGGLVVYAVEAPPEWDFHTYNGHPDVIHDYLRRQRARRIRIPYRGNRAIIFNSDLFHATEAVRFRPGYLNRRLNVTMLYGQREADAHHGARPPVVGEVAGWRSAAFSRRRR